MRFLVDFMYLLAAVLVSPVVLYRTLTTGKYRRDWDQRLGRIARLPRADRRVWIHAVSVGEVNAARGLIEQWLKSRSPTDIVITTTTDTGQDRARKLFPELTILRYPLDFSWCVKRSLDAIGPSLIVLVELEVWYQFVTIASRRGIPVAVMNGRLSERSVRRFSWVGPLIRPMFRQLAWVGAQDETYAERFRKMGVPADRVTVTGSVKWDTSQVSDTIPGDRELALEIRLDLNRPIWICGSTGPGEESIVLEAYDSLRRDHPRLQLVIVPRKPERFDEVATLIQAKGYNCVRRSESTKRQGPAADNSVFLGDSMGELRKFYSLANVVFVGRSLAAMGGSDMMEVAALAKPIVVGPHTENFTETVEQLERAEAIRIITSDLGEPHAADQLRRAVGGLLDDSGSAKIMGNKAREVVVKNRGATCRTLDELREILERAEHPVAQTIDG